MDGMSLLPSGCTVMDVKAGDGDRLVGHLACCALPSVVAGKYFAAGSSSWKIWNPTGEGAFVTPPGRGLGPAAVVYRRLATMLAVPVALVGVGDVGLLDGPGGR